MIDTLVIGAGVAGCAAGHALRAGGANPLVVEARDRVGGRVCSVRDFGPAPIETGAEFIHGIDAATWPAVRAAGLAVRPCSMTRGAMMHVNGRTLRLPWVLLDPRVWPTFGILRAIRNFQATDRSAAEFLRGRPDRGPGRILAEMTLGTHPPGPLDQIGMRGLVEDRLVKLETGLNHRVNAGYDRLPAALADDLEIQLGFEVTRIEWSPQGVRAVAADGREVSAASGICSLPVGVLKAGGIEFDPPLPEAKREALQKIEMGPVVKILLRFRERFWPRWLTTLGADGPIGTYWPPLYGLDNDAPLLTAYSTGPRAAALSAASEDAAIATALRDLARLFPKFAVAAALVDARRIDWPADPFACGGYSYLRPGGSGARAALGARDTGRLFWAGDAVASSQIAAVVSAAYETGIRAANSALESLNGAAA